MNLLRCSSHEYGLGGCEIFGLSGRKQRIRGACSWRSGAPGLERLQGLRVLGARALRDVAEAHLRKKLPRPSPGLRRRNPVEVKVRDGET